MEPIAVLLVVCAVATLLVGVPIAAAAIAQRDGPTARFLRRHARAVWLAVALGWGAATVLQVLNPGRFEAWLGWVFVLPFLCAIYLAFFGRFGSPERAGPPE